MPFSTGEGENISCYTIYNSSKMCVLRVYSPVFFEVFSRGDSGASTLGSRVGIACVAACGVPWSIGEFVDDFPIKRY